MQVWQRLLIIVPAGLLLGMAGANYARPEMVERAGDVPWQSMFQSRADRSGGSTDYAAQPQGDLSYVGGYSYAPDFAQQSASWTRPIEDRWSEAPLPTIAQLDARQAKLLADPEVEFAVHSPTPVTDVETAPADDTLQPSDPSSTLVASAEPLETGREPSKADGEPAIW